MTSKAASTVSLLAKGFVESGTVSGDRMSPLSESSIPVERRLMRRLLANSAGVVELMVIVTEGGVSGVGGSTGFCPLTLSPFVVSLVLSSVKVVFGGNLIVQQVVSVSGVLGVLLLVTVLGVEILLTGSLDCSLGTSWLFTFIIILLKSCSDEFEF